MNYKRTLYKQLSDYWAECRMILTVKRIIKAKKVRERGIIITNKGTL